MWPFTFCRKRFQDFLIVASVLSFKHGFQWLFASVTLWIAPYASTIPHNPRAPPEKQADPHGKLASGFIPFGATCTSMTVQTACQVIWQKAIWKSRVNFPLLTFCWYTPDARPYRQGPHLSTGSFTCHLHACVYAYLTCGPKQHAGSTVIPMRIVP